MVDANVSTALDHVNNGGGGGGGGANGKGHVRLNGAIIIDVLVVSVDVMV